MNSFDLSSGIKSYKSQLQLLQVFFINFIYFYFSYILLLYYFTSINIVKAFFKIFIYCILFHFILTTFTNNGKNIIPNDVYKMHVFMFLMWTHSFYPLLQTTAYRWSWSFRLKTVGFWLIFFYFCSFTGSRYTIDLLIQKKVTSCLISLSLILSTANFTGVRANTISIKYPFSNITNSDWSMYSEVGFDRFLRLPFLMCLFFVNYSPEFRRINVCKKH